MRSTWMGRWVDAIATEIAWRVGGASAGLALLLLGMPGPAAAQCLPVAQAPARVILASHLAGPAEASAPRHQLAALAGASELGLTYLGHSSFLIESPGGASAITDYNGMVLVAEPPDVVTMNNAHSTHYTDFVPAEIPHVLRGWDPDGGVALHDLTVDDLHVRNVPTNVREFAGARRNGNSVFVFEAADLCVAHLGHLHHLLTDVHLGELGMIDILLVPVDGAYTMAQELMVEVIGQIAPSIIIPMHYFGDVTLARFLKLVEGRYEVVVHDGPSIALDRATLPYRKVLVLPPGSAG